MRDALILAILPFMLYSMAKRPFVGLGLWIWTALFFPNGWLYGIASSIRFNLLFTGMTIFAYVMLKPKPAFKLTPTGTMVLLFFAWTTASTVMCIGNPDVAWEIWSRFAKVIALFIFVLAIVENKVHIDFFLWCTVLSVGFFGDLEALKYLLSGGGHMIEGMNGHVLGDRNELSVAFLMTLPMCVYLLQEYGKRSKLVALALGATIVLMIIAVIGTQSRGGFVVLVALGGYFFIKSERKGLLTVLLVGLVLVMAQVVTSEWIARMQTVDSVDKDASFMGRVVAWKLSFILASHHPFFGGGFKALENFSVWTGLSQDFSSLTWFPSGDSFPDQERPHAAHSVYFQVLGDHGFVGLGIYLSFLLGAFLKARKITRLARLHKLDGWIPRMGATLQLTLFAFCLGGSDLSFSYFDLTFAVIGLLVVMESRILPAAIQEAQRERQRELVLQKEHELAAA